MLFFNYVKLLNDIYYLFTFLRSCLQILTMIVIYLRLVVWLAFLNSIKISPNSVTATTEVIFTTRNGNTETHPTQGPCASDHSFPCDINLSINLHTHLFYYLRHVRRLPLSIPIRLKCRSNTLILLLMSGIEPNPGPRTPRYPCGVCSRAVRNIGQRALACDECDN